MIEKEILQEIIEWLGNDTSYLSTRTDYAKGYKDGIEQAKVFTNALDIQGAIVSKLDSTAKGGVAISVAHYLSLPIYYGGFGEKVDDFREFDIDNFIDSILQ